MNLVDLVVLVVVALAAVQGLRLGAIVQVLSFGGFWIGLYLGALLASVTVQWGHSQSTRTAFALVTLLGVATLCGVVGRIVGNLAFTRVHRGTLGTVDSALGVVVAVVASLLAAWLLANTLVNSSSLALNSSIDRSRIVRSLDNVLPAPRRSSPASRASCHPRGSHRSSPSWRRPRPVRWPCPAAANSIRPCSTPGAPR